MGNGSGELIKLKDLCGRIVTHLQEPHINFRREYNKRRLSSLWENGSDSRLGFSEKVKKKVRVKGSGFLKTAGFEGSVRQFTFSGL